MMKAKQVSLSRRDFLRLAMLAAGSALLSGCLPPTSRPAVGEEDYYISQTDQLLKDFDDYQLYLHQVLEAHYADAEIRAMEREARQEYAALISQLPYIGGEANMLTFNLVQSAWCLASYQVLRTRGQTVESVGRILYETVNVMMRASPRGFSRLGGLIQTSSLAVDGLKVEAELSQQRRYPGDWVFTVVESKGDDFDVGVDYSECGVHKFYQAQQAAELMPYVCLLDFPMSIAMDTGLVRTMTLAEGDAKCDFRYKLGRATQPVLPPGFLEVEW